MKLNEMGMMSDVAREMQGRLPAKDHMRRMSLTTLQRIVDGISEKELMNMFGPNPDGGELYGYLNKLRADAIEAIQVIKGIE